MRTTIAALLIVCCLLGWYSFASDPVTPPPGVVEQEERDTQPGTGQQATANAAPIEASATRESVVTTNELDNPLAPELPDDARWIDVRVVMRDSGEPVPNALVYWSNQLQHKLTSKLPPHERPDYRQPDLVPKVYGWRTRSDADGMIRIVPGKGNATVLAMKDGMYGRATFGSDPPPRDGHKLEIEPDVVLKVLVRTAAGEAARGVPVATTQHDPSKKRPTRFWWWNRATVETDEHGIATFEHMQFEQRTGSRHDAKPVLQWLVHVRAAGHSIEPVAVDAQKPPEEPVEVQLPASGHLRVHVMTGRKGLPHAKVMLWEKPDSKQRNQPSYMTMHGAIHATADEHGWVEFRHVALHKTFFVGNYTWKHEVVGPMQDDATAKHAVSIDDQAVVLAGRLLHPDGTAIANENCTIKVKNDNGELNNTTLYTEDDGSFLSIMHPGRDKKPHDRARIEFRWDPAGQEGLTTELAPRVLHIGRTELGDVRLQTANLIVSGRIVTNHVLQSACNLQIQKMYPRKDGTPRWEWLYGVSVRVDKDLNFSAYGTLKPGRYRLQVYNNELTPGEPVEFAIGARNLIIERRCGNVLRMHCLLPGRLDGSRVKLQLTKQNSKKNWHARRRSSEPGTADYSWRGLEDGTYTLEVRTDTWGRTAAAHRIEGIQLPLAGQREGTLPDLDLRTMLDVVEVDIAFANGKKDSAFVFVMPQETDMWKGIEVPSGKTTLPIAPGATEILVAAWNHEPVTVHPNAGQAAATLHPRPKTEFQLSGLESAGSDYRVTLYATSTTKSPLDKRKFQAGWGSNDLDNLLKGSNSSTRLKAGKGSMTLREGSHRLELRVRHNKTRRSSKRLKALTPNEITSGGTYQVHVDAAELAAALKEAAEPRKKK